MHARMTRFLLEHVGYRVSHEEHEEGVRYAVSHMHVDLVLLDEHFPGFTNDVLCKEVHALYHTPIICMIESTMVMDRVRVLKLGADDVVQKPYHPNELLARIEAVMRRYSDAFLRLRSTYEPLTVGKLFLDPVQRLVVIDGQREESLTEREFQLLYYLVQHAHCILSSRQLLQRIWGFDEGTDSNLVSVYMGRLRRKIEQDPLNPTYLVRVRDMGYCFQPV